MLPPRVGGAGHERGRDLRDVSQSATSGARARAAACPAASSRCSRWRASCAPARELLLLDEITEGLAPVIVKTLGRAIRQLKEKGYTIVMVEQNFRFAAPLADRHYVVERGRVVETVTKDELSGAHGYAARISGRVNRSILNDRGASDEKAINRLVLALACAAWLWPAGRRWRKARSRTTWCKIGVLTDMSGLYSDIGGQGSVVAAQMAIDDFGGKVLGKKIELVSADHQNKADVAAQKVREWYRPRRRGHDHRRAQLGRRAGSGQGGRREEAHPDGHRRGLHQAHQRRLHALHHPPHLRHLCAGQRHRAARW